MKKSSANVLLRALKAGMNTAVRLELIDKNPLAKCALLKVPPIEPSYMTPEEFTRLLAAIDDQAFRVFVVVAVLTGMRRGELIHLRWTDVDMERRLVKISNSPDFTVKGSRARVIPVNGDLFKILQAVRKTSDFVLCQADGHAFSPGCVTRKFKEAVRRAGLPETLHLHSLRHTYASWLIQKGVGLPTIQRLLGHSSVTITQVYLHLDQDHLRSAVEEVKLPAAFIDHC